VAALEAVFLALFVYVSPVLCFAERVIFAFFSYGVVASIPMYGVAWIA